MNSLRHLARILGFDAERPLDRGCDLHVDALLQLGCDRILEGDEIDGSRRYGNLSSAIRLFVLEHFRAKSNFTRPDSRETKSQMAD